VPFRSRRLVLFTLSALLLLPSAGPLAAISHAAEPPDAAALAQSERYLVVLLNRQRAARNLVAFHADPDLMAVARARARVMAANDVLSHTEPNGQLVYARLNAAGVIWYGAGEIIAWNLSPTATSAVDAIRAWMASAGHRAIMISTQFNYVGFGAAVSASGRHYFAGVMAREPDQTAPWVRFGTTSRTAIDAARARVTVRWAGADTRLQVLTSGLRYFQVERRYAGGAWIPWTLTTATHLSVTWTRGLDRDVRVRARDRAGNWSAWRPIRVSL
jgi:uncharacterized protein YkwD